MWPDESVEHVLFDCNTLKQEGAASLDELIKGRRVPEEELVQGIQRFLDPSGLPT